MNLNEQVQREHWCWAFCNRSRVVDDYKILLVKTNFIAKCVFVGHVLTQGVVQSAGSTTIYQNGP